MVRNNAPVVALMMNPAMPHGISALTWRIGRPRNMPMRRRSSRPAAPISMQRPMKCRDSQSGHNHDIPNNVFEREVDSTHAANSVMPRFHSVLQVRHQPARDDRDDP